MRRFLLNYLELHLSAVGLLLTLLIPYLFRNQADIWQVAAITACVTGALHGLIFWGVRRRQRRVRERAIADMREMLQDVVLNRVASISLSTQMLARSGVQTKYTTRIQDELHKIELVMNAISDDSLMEWQNYYGNMEDVARARSERYA